MTSLLYHFRRHPVRRAYKRSVFFIFLFRNLGASEICQLTSAIFFYQYVSRLDVSVDNIVSMQVLYSFNYLPCVNCDDSFTHGMVLFVQLHQCS